MFAKTAKRTLLAALGCGLFAIPLPAQALASISATPTSSTPVVSAPASDTAQTGGAAPSPESSTALNLGHPQLATWFGPGFYGHETACGQVLRPTLVGVANRTLACGTLVEVSYFGRHLVVPVVDRGPYGHIGADWDLTGGAAKALKITQTVHVHTQVVGHVADSPTLGLPAEPSLAALPGTTPATAVTGGASAG